MATNFFTKKRWVYIGISQLLACFLLIFLLYAVYLNGATSVWFGKNFYFLVSKNARIEVATHETRLEGGAGYLLQDEGAEYIVWSVYLNEAEGKTVHASLSEDTQLVKKPVTYLYFKGKDKERMQTVQSALNCLYGCIDVLSQGISQLSHGGTQEACRRFLGILEKQFSYLETAYQNNYPHFSNVCANVHKQLESILKEKTIFAKDLRYVLCGACEDYIHLSAEFSI